MRSLLVLRKTPASFLLRCLSNNKPFCSQSRFPKESENPSPVTSENESRVIDTRLNRKNNPQSALRFYNWAKPWRGSFEDGDAFWVLIHILVSSPETYGHASQLLIRYISSSNPKAMPSVLVSRFVDSAKLIGFEVNSRAFNYFLNAYIKDRQTDFAVKCIDMMMGLGVVPFVPYLNSTLNALIRRNSIIEAKELYSKMVGIGVAGT